MPTRAIRSIFFTRFHHEKGARILHQVPPGSVTPSSAPSALQTPLFDFSTVTQYIIPTQQFCDRLLTFCVNHYRVIGYPVCIREGKYSRNEFIFNFAVVIGEDELDWACYGEVVRKLGRLLRGLEEQGGFLSKEEESIWDDEGAVDAASSEDPLKAQVAGFGSKVYALCEMILEDLNNYAECMIPIDDSNTINLKLFPTRPPPPPILSHQVPILTIALKDLQIPISSDLTLNRILNHIDGIKPISRIAQVADTDLSLTRRAIQHLVYYGCIVLLDIFSFSAIYAVTAEIDGFIADENVKDECVRYVRIPWQLSPHQHPDDHDEPMRPDISRNSSSTQTQKRIGIFTTTTTTSSTSSSTSSTPSSSPPSTPKPSTQNPPSISHESLITLYTSLRQGFPLRAWVLEHLPLLSGIDVRRLITFGLIKGFVYRVHKYAIATSSALPPAPPSSLLTSAATSVVAREREKESDAGTVRVGGGGGGVSVGGMKAGGGDGGGMKAGAGVGAPRAADGVGRVGAGVQGHGQTTTAGVISQAGGPSNPTLMLHRASTATVGGGNAHQQQQYRLDMHDADGGRDNALSLLRFLDGMHCFDELCSELNVSEKVLEERLRGMGEGMAVVVHR